MKGRIINIILVVALIAAVVIQESRIAKLRSSLENHEKSELAYEQGSEAKRVSSESSSDEPASKTEREEKVASESNEEKTPAREFGKTMRKMAENPAAQAMFAHAHKASVLAMYGQLIDELDLSEEEKEYFVNLLAGDLADQQQLGMKLMGAQTDEERDALFAEMKESSDERKKAVKDFLNDDEDHEKFESYHERLAEYQQIPGIKAAMSAAGADLGPGQERKLVDAMYEARLEANGGKKRDDAEEFAKLQTPDAIEQFEQEWQRGQEILGQKLGGVLDETQMEALMQSQEQMKEFQLMGIKMMQGMMGEGEN